MTFLELKNEVLLRLGEDSASPVHHLASDVGVSLNEGYELMAETSGFYEKSANISIINALYYDLNDVVTLNLGAGITFLNLRYLYSNQNRRWLSPTMFRELDETVYPVWERAIGEPDWWLIRGGWWLGLYPHKQTVSGTLTANCTAIPAWMVNDADVPAYPQEFDECLINYALYDQFCWEHEWSKAKRHWAIYVGLQGKLNAYVERRGMEARQTQFGGVI